MAEIVGGFILPHAPLYLALNNKVDTEKKQACDAAFTETRKRIKDLNADTIVLIGDDHYTIFGPGCIPSALIGIGDVTGPVEPWLGVDHARIPGNEPLANHIMRYGHSNGVDWAIAKELNVDHSIYVPWHFAIKPMDNVKTVPVYLNSGVEPLIQNQRCYDIGQSIAAAVAAWEGNERVVVIGTGGGAHWPGLGKMEDLNAEWDLELIKLVEQGDAKALIAMPDEEVREAGGNGGWELKNWICMMGALGENAKGETFCYQDANELFAAFVYLQMSKAA